MQSYTELAADSIRRSQQALEDLPLAAVGLDAELAAQTAGKTRVVRDPESGANEFQRDLLTDVKAIHDQVIQQKGVIPATLLNMHPWELKATGQHNEGIVVPPCPIADDYVQYVHKSYRRDFSDRWGNFKVQPVWPIMLMRDFAQQHAQWGGIVVYMGDNMPGEQKKHKSGAFDKFFALLDKIGEKLDPDTRKAVQELVQEREAEEKKDRLSESEIWKLIQNANQIRITEYEKYFEEAEQALVLDKANGYRKVTRRHRLVAQWLFHRQYIKTLPTWVTEKKPKGFTPTNCHKCGSEVNLEKGFACVKCNAIYHGIRAYRFGEIGLDSVALKRHTREELDAAGLNQVKTLAEERAEVEAEAESKKGKKEAKA